MMKTIRTPHSGIADTDALLDEALRETFPASDPIACTPASEAGAPRTRRASGRAKGASVAPGQGTWSARGRSVIRRSALTAG
ncbi:hypothetical protein A6V36_33390 [Paraburkholderia ginsengiterrae]|uniref:Uncharacterized protein n=1 Tax=Paraburkholderia ginsengiterrae TaxID=1462993 RepID=A0ABX2URS5_9BURK|nr:hypothetical protein A6V36_33390 [Paraburkholderia ginsengiterrae]